MDKKSDTLFPDRVIPGVYRHYKGGMYQVLGVARNANTEERSVLYLPLGIHDGMAPMLTYRPVNGPDGFFSPVSVRGEICERFVLLCASNFTLMKQQEAPA